MSRTKPVYSLLLVGTALFGASLVGCGGGSSSSSASLTGPGRMVVTLKWDGPTSKSAQKAGRDAHLGGIPAAANTVTVLVQTPTSQQVQAITLTRPTDGTTTTTTTIEHLPLRLLNIDVKSYAGDASGVVLSENSYQEVIESNKTMQLAIDSTSNLAQLSTDTAVNSLMSGQSVSVKPIAHDPHGNIITPNMAGLTWTSSDASIVSVDWANGTATLTGHKAGVATITVTDANSGISYSFQVTVMTPPASSVVVTLPTDALQLGLGESHTFAAAVTGTTQTGVNWSVVEAGGGSITANGVYTAPGVPGVYHIMAVSVADPTKSATFAVTVVVPLPGSLNLDVH